MNKDEDLIADAREAFDRAVDAESSNRNEALDDLRFARLGEQWPPKIVQARATEGRPCLTINRLPSFIRQVVNDARQNKPAINVHPVDSAADPDTAEVLSGLIRHIEQSSDAEVAYDTALDAAVTGGFGYFRINTRYATDDTFMQDICIERIANPFSVYGDPDSMAVDSSDWNVAFVLDRMTKTAFKRRWKDADAVSFEGDGTSSAKSGGEDTVQTAEYWTREETRRRIIALSAPTNMDPDPEAAAMAADLVPESLVIEEEVYAENKDLFDHLGMRPIGQSRDVASHKVTQRILSGCDVLDTVDWAGRWIPIVPVYGEEIIVEGERTFRSLVRDAKDPQRMFNYWRTTSTELVALAPKAPFIGPVGAFTTDSAKWATANVQSHAYIEFDTQDAEGRSIAIPPQRQPFSGVPAGALQEAMNAADDMKSIMGLYDASLGAKSNETSGRAIIARQREGDVSTFHYIDNLSRAIRHGGRIIVDLIPKVYGMERMVRILGPDGNASEVKVAPKVSAGPSAAPGADQQMPPQAAEADDEAQNDQAEDIARVFDLTTGKYDVTVTAGPSYTTQREEAASQMIELIRAYPAAAPVIGDLLAKNLDWPGADEIAERLQKLLPAQLQGDDPAAQAAKAQIAQMAQLIGELRGKLAASEADKSIEGRRVEIDAYNAETGRLKAIAPKGTGFDEAQMGAAVATWLVQIIQSPDILNAVASGAPQDQIAAMLAQKRPPPEMGAAPAEPPQGPQGLPGGAMAAA